MTDQQTKRISVKLKNPNPLFEKWIIEWRDKAKENGSKMQYTFNLALQSLKKYPIPLETAKDCKILKGFGDKLCSMLDQKLAEHKQTEGTLQNNITKKSPHNKKSKTYIPQHRSGAYGILLALYKNSLEPDSVGYMSKIDLIQKAYEFTDKSFTKPDPGSHYTAWSSMSKLISEELVLKKSNPAKYSITEKGILIAEQLQNDYNELGCDNNNQNEDKNTVNISDSPKIFKRHISENNVSDNKKKAKKILKKYQSEVAILPVQKFPSTSSTVSSVDEYVIFGPNSFDIILLVDSSETAGKSNIQDDRLILELKRLNVTYEIQKLKVGDYAWICRSKTSNIDLVLPYIIERKRMDDFSASIKDGRYYEQKFRLKKCGIPNVTYLIESYGSNDHVGMPLANLYQAATNTAIQDGFCVKFTDNIQGTAQYLNCLTGLLCNIFKGKTVASCRKDDLPEFKVDDDIVSLISLKEFNEQSSKSKNVTIKDHFIKSLLQVKGLSVEKALAIAEVYPNARSLYEAYKLNPGVAGEKLLSGLQFGNTKKNIGPVLSKIVYQLFTNSF